MTATASSAVAPSPSAARAAMRVRLLEAALAMLKESGPETLQARKLTAEIGTSTQALYTHFGGMPWLFEAMVANGFLRIASHIETIPETDDPMADHFARGWALCDWALAHPQLYRLMFGLTGAGLRLHTGLEMAMTGAMANFSDGQTEIPTPHIKLVGTGKAEDSTGTASSISLSFPSASPDDQILVGVSEDAGESATISGYSQVGSYTTGSGERLQIFNRTATGGESSATVSFSPSTDAHAKGAVALVYRGVDPAKPIDASSGTATSSSTSVTAPPVTASAAGDQLVMFQGSLNGTSGNWSPPSSMTEEVQENQLLSAVGASDMVLGSSGSSGSQTASYSGTLGNLAAALVALNSRKPLYLLQDQLGSVRLVVDETGKWVATYTYSSFGQVLEQTGDPTVLSTNPIGFSGAYTDQESGYLYLVNRFYGPATAQFLSVDPLAWVTQAPYSYAGDDPVNNTDPLGLFCFFGKNPNGGCRGSDVAKAVITNPIFQTVTTVGVCTFTGGSACAAIVAGFLAANEYYAYQSDVQQGCDNWGRFALSSVLNVASAAIQGSALPSSGEELLQDELGNTVLTRPFYSSSKAPLSTQIQYLVRNGLISGSANGINWITQYLLK